MLSDGFSTIVTLENIPDVKLFEREVSASGYSAGGAISTTTMRSVVWRSQFARSLLTLAPVSATVAFATNAIPRIIGQVGVNQQVVLTFPNGAVLVFYGWIEEFRFNAFAEGEQPTASVLIQPSLSDLEGNETEPQHVLSFPVTLTVEIVQEVAGLLYMSEHATLLVSISNTGDEDAEDVEVTVILPASFTFVSSDPASMQNGNIITFTVGELLAGEGQDFEITVTPTAEGNFTTTAVLSTSNDTTEESVLSDTVSHEVFDRGPCAVPGITDGGGDTFDCYDDGSFVGGATGTGFTGEWKSAENPFGVAFGDTFDTYADGTPTAMEDGTGFTDGWKFN